MKVKVTEIEANAEELRQSKTLSDALTNILRKSFIGAYPLRDEWDEFEDDEQTGGDDE